jgi:hypothetical protein
MQFPITKKTLREDVQTAEMELIAAQYRGRARVLQAKLFVNGSADNWHILNCILLILAILKWLPV